MLRNGRKRGLSFIALCAILLLFSCSGMNKIPDYSGFEEYTSLFSGEDDELDREIKNAMIDHIRAYNEGNFEKYVSIFDMDSEDREFNLNTFQTLSQRYVLSFQLLSIDTATINEENGQAGMVLEAQAVDRETNETLYHTRYQVIYTLVKRDGVWIVAEQQKGEETEVSASESVDG